MALETGDRMAARRYAEEAIELHRVVDDPWAKGISLGLLGNVHAVEWDFEGALPLFEAALEEHRSFGDDHRALVAMDNIAGMRLELRRNSSSARHFTRRSFRRAKAAGDLRMEASSLSALGEYALREDRVAEALPLLVESYGISRDLEDSAALLDVLYRIAWALRSAREPPTPLACIRRRRCCGREPAVPFSRGSSAKTNQRLRASMPRSTKAPSRARGTRGRR